jgi:hypothetical protein
LNFPSKWPGYTPAISFSGFLARTARAVWAPAPTFARQSHNGCRLTAFNVAREGTV